MSIALKILGIWFLVALIATPFMCAFLIGANPYRHRKDQKTECEGHGKAH